MTAVRVQARLHDIAAADVAAHARRMVMTKLMIAAAAVLGADLALSVARADVDRHERRDVAHPHDVIEV